MEDPKVAEQPEETEDFFDGEIDDKATADYDVEETNAKEVSE
jgi:hypothetical protein